MIKEHISKIQRGDCSKTEVTLTGICLVLAGIVLGMKLAPFRVSTFGKERKEFDEVPENFTYD